ncbi:MAG: hypothetical protein IJJ77_07870 [Paludibacteraceae bacterium]|nr:hypothetical protein [Paludibacteraceae bacterium]MBO7635038.1 hypothetical protein [Paludibacteraceae bacterium]MBR0503145.1 hypothetical protein [Paludibacteraceae bacterium]
MQSDVSNLHAHANVHDNDNTLHESGRANDHANVRGHGSDNDCGCVHVPQNNSNVRDDVPYTISIYDYYFCFTWQK